MKRITLALLIVTMSTGTAMGGWRQRRVNVGRPGGVVLTNVPVWAANRLQRAPGPIVVTGRSRRPWVSALTNMNTPSARMANYYQNGGGAGPVPGYTNEPGYFVPCATWNYPIP